MQKFSIRPLYWLFAVLYSTLVQAAPPDLDLAKSLVESVHTDVRTASLLNNRLLACFRGDSTWFSKNGIPLDQNIQDECQRRISSLRKIIQDNMPRLRLALALEDIESAGDSHDLSYRWPISATEEADWLARAPWLFDLHLTRHITHQYRGLADLQELSPDEIKAAVNELNIALQAMPPGSDNNQYFAHWRHDFAAQYKTLLMKNPILGYFAMATPSNDDIIFAIEKLSDKSTTFQNSFEKTYYANGQILEAKLDHNHLIALAQFEGSIDRLAKLKPQFSQQLDQLKVDAQNAQTWRNREVIGLMVVATIGCQVVGARVPGLTLFKSMCTPTVLIGIGGAQAIVGEIDYGNALEAVFQSPYGWTALYEIDQLDEISFDRLMNWALLPLGTGLPVLKFLSPRLIGQLAAHALR